MAKVRRTREQWQRLIDKQAQSGLSINQFCIEHQLTLSNFYLWRKKLTETTNPASEPHEWLSLPPLVSCEPEQWQIELSLPGGVVLRMNRPA